MGIESGPLHALMEQSVRAISRHHDQWPTVLMLRFHSFAYAGIAFVAARGIFSEDSLSEVMTFENPWHDSARLLGKMGGLLVSATAGRAAGEALHLASLVGSDHRQPTAQN